MVAVGLAGMAAVRSPESTERCESPGKNSGAVYNIATVTRGLSEREGAALLVARPGDATAAEVATN